MTRRVARRSFAGRWDLVSLGRRLQALGGRLRWFAGLARRAGAPGRIALALVAGGLLVGVALLGDFTPLQAQEGDATQEQGSGTQVGIRLVDLVDRITHTIVHQFTVEVDSLTASAAYEVIVSSDTAALGIDSCGTTSQRQLVTGTASHAFKVIVYACAVDGGTVTAEVRRSGSSTAAASASQGVTVLPIPDYVPADERPARGATRNVARVGTPGIVQNVQVAERGPTSFKITWSPPAGNGGEPLTGYGLLIWHEDTTQPPYNQAASIGVTDNHTFTGLQPSNTYNFRIHACNGTDSCGWWTDILEATTTAATPAPGTPTAPHSILSDQVGANSFRVRWSPHAETGGSALTGFGILVRESGSSWDENRTVWVDEDPPHRYSVTGRDANTTYVVKIKSCNGEDGRSSCSAWSADHRVTTTAVETNPGIRPVLQQPVTPKCPYTTGTGTAWGKPQNLDVTPHEGREITLCWTPVTAATGYTVSATHEPTASSPVYTTVGHITSGTTTHLVVHLDNVYTTTPKVGLGNHGAFGLKVTATQTSSSVTHESDMIIIIDTPITKADGKSASGEGNGKVLVEWNSVGDILGDAYSEGEYDLRHRKSLATYNAYSPRIPNFFENTGDPAENKASPFAIRNLATSAVYAIQLVYRAEGPSANTADDDIWVFAARHAYAWVSDEPIANNSRVAGVPVTSRIKGTTYTYKICTTTFDPGNRTEAWIDLIDRAYKVWQDAVTTDLFEIRRDGNPCQDYHTIATKIVDHHAGLASQSTYTKQRLIELTQDFIHTTINSEVVDLIGIDESENEIKLVNDVDGAEAYLDGAGLFPEMAKTIGHRTDCWYTSKTNLAGVVEWERNNETLMCTSTVHQVDDSNGAESEQHRSSDIFISRRHFASKPLLEPESDAMFNACGNAGDDRNSAFQSFLHEAGHALGIAGTHPGLSGDPEPGHSESNVASVVNKVLEPDCAPHPADIMALYALYQTR